MEASKSIEEALLTTAWSLWAELGVAGVERHHRDCAVDPEALLLFTSALADRDRRLRDESLDCALVIAPCLFVSRLKVLLKAAAPGVQEQFEALAATFNNLSKTYVRLPAKRSASAWKVKPSGKSQRGAFDRPSQIILRCRSIFGVAARADVVATMVCLPRLGWTAAELAERARLTKRVVASALQDLERGGLVRSTAIANRLRYDLVGRGHLAETTGTKPKRMPPWSSILPFMAGTLALVGRAPGRNETALLVDGQNLIGGYLSELARVGLTETAPAFDTWPDVSAWLVAQVELVASGQSHWLVETTIAA